MSARSHRQSLALGKRGKYPHPGSQALGSLLHHAGQAQQRHQATKHGQHASGGPGSLLYSQPSVPQSVLPASVVANDVGSIHAYNFERTCREAKIFDRNFTTYKVVHHKCPALVSKFDCGIYVMLLMLYWDGKFISEFESDPVTKFRKLVAHKLLVH